jgi:hypothetical protein
MRFLTRAYSFLFIYFAFASGTQAQQAVFNVPSPDVLDKGKVYVELDASFKTNNREALQRFSSFVPRVVVGAGGNVEIGLNVIGNLQPGADTTTLVPTVKWKFYQSEKKDLALFAGNNLYVPLRNKSFNIGTYAYVAVSKTIRERTRLTAGAYIYSKNVVAVNASRGGGQFAIEQTINSKVTLAADWITGKHASGYFTPGVIYKPHSRVTTYFSYSLGNTRLKQGNHYFLFEIGYNFN